MCSYNYDLEEIDQMTPFENFMAGISDGPVQLLMVAMILVHRNSMALYEHGTFVPILQPEVAERMTKNPDHFELKYFDRTPPKAALIKHASARLKTDSSVLTIVSHIVRATS